MKNLDKYEKGKVILLEELQEDGYTIEELAELVKAGELCQCDFCDDVYYINDPVDFMGITLNTTITSDAVVYKKYMGDNNDYGFFYSFSALNRYGACTQVPYVVSICSTKVDEYTEIILDGRKFKIYSFEEEYGGDYNPKKAGFFIADVIFNRFFNWIDYSLRTVVNNFYRGFNMSLEDVLSVVKNIEARRGLEVLRG